MLLFKQIYYKLIVKEIQVYVCIVNIYTQGINEIIINNKIKKKDVNDT